MIIMKNWFLGVCTAVVIMVAISACQPAIGNSNANGQNENIGLPADESSQPTAFMPEESIDTPVALEASRADELWMKIDEPQDGAVVNTPQIELKGQATTDTVITINDEILYVESNQEFATMLNLSSGANLYEIIASDIQGNELTLYLTIYYEP